MKNVYEELYKRITELERYVVDSEKSEKNDIYTLRDVIFESIKNTDFLEKIKNDTDKYYLTVNCDGIYKIVYDNITWEIPKFPTIHAAQFWALTSSDFIGTM